MTSVVVSGRRDEAGHALAAELRALGARAEYLRADVRVEAEVRVMLRQGAGAIVNLSSVAGQVGMSGASVYAASKHAVEGLTRSAALEGAAAGVRVNAVAPGPIQTDMLERFTGGNEAAKNGFLASLPARRAGTPDEIANTIVFLAGESSRFLTGQCLAVDGGFTAA